jgi:hypothetical protein
MLYLVKTPFGEVQEVPCLLDGVLGQMSMILKGLILILSKEVPWTTLTVQTAQFVLIRAIKQCHLGGFEFYHSQSFKYAARNLPKVSSFQRDSYATANLLKTLSCSSHVNNQS